MAKTKREVQLQREIENKLRKATTVAIENIPASPPGSSGGISEAPIDGILYGRKDGTWAEIILTGGFTQEEIEDFVGALIIDSSDLNFTYNDGVPSISAVINNGVVTEAKMLLADNTTYNVDTTKHGFVPKAPSDTSVFLRGDAAWATPPSDGWTNIIKTADQSKTADTVFANDNTLVFTPPSTGAYVVEIVLFYSTGSAEDIKIQVAFAGTQTAWQLVGQYQAVSASINGLRSTAPSTSSGVLNGGAGEGHIVLRNRFVCSVVGVWSLQWAQNVSGATATIMQAGSYIRYKKIN